MLVQNIAIGCDHAGIELKRQLIKHLQSTPLTVIDCGTDGDDSVDYPDYGKKVAQTVINTPSCFGIIICGSGIGISIAANRYPEIRAALCHTAELATLARRHNDANILALGARFISVQTAIDCVDAFISTPFEGGRHQQRVAKLSTT